MKLIRLAPIVAVLFSLFGCTSHAGELRDDNVMIDLTSAHGEYWADIGGERYDIITGQGHTALVDYLASLQKRKITEHNGNGEIKACLRIPTDAKMKSVEDLLLSCAQIEAMRLSAKGDGQTETTNSTSADGQIYSFGFVLRKPSDIKKRDTIEISIRSSPLIGYLVVTPTKNEAVEMDLDGLYKVLSAQSPSVKCLVVSYDKDVLWKSLIAVISAASNYKNLTCLVVSAHK